MDKNSLAIFCDAHFHLLPSEEALKGLPFSLGRACSAAHSPEEFLEQEKRVRELNQKYCGGIAPGSDRNGGDVASAIFSPRRENLLIQSYGLHPQEPFLDEKDFKRRGDFLEGLLNEGRVQAVGECGFDFWSEEFSANRARQEKAFYLQLELAARHEVPVVVHARKAMQEIFKAASDLKKVPAVIFHSFAGSPMDALSFLSKGINAYFSFGKPIINGAKKAVHCVRALPLDRMLFETDAPYQSLKGEKATSPVEIPEVYQAAFELRFAGSPYEARPSFYDFAAKIEKNFFAAFDLEKV